MAEFRMKRVNELVLRELSNLIRENLRVEDYGMITVTEVQVSKDLKSATVYVSFVGTPQQEQGMLGSLEKIRPMLQHQLSRKVVLKYTPQLNFKHDHGLERGQHVVELLDSLDEEGQKS
jgi:ribosome-binding factor A